MGQKLAHYNHIRWSLMKLKIKMFSYWTQQSESSRVSSHFLQIKRIRRSRLSLFSREKAYSPFFSSFISQLLDAEKACNNFRRAKFICEVKRASKNNVSEAEGYMHISVYIGRPCLLCPTFYTKLINLSFLEKRHSRHPLSPLPPFTHPFRLVEHRIRVNYVRNTLLFGIKFQKHPPYNNFTLVAILKTFAFIYLL